MSKSCIARIEQKLDDLIERNSSEHSRIVGRLDKVNGCMGENGEAIAVIKEQNNNQKWINRTLFGSLIALVFAKILGGW